MADQPDVDSNNSGCSATETSDTPTQNTTTENVDVANSVNNTTATEETKQQPITMQDISLENTIDESLLITEEPIPITEDPISTPPLPPSTTTSPAFEQKETFSDESVSPSSPFAKLKIHLNSSESQFYGQLYRALDYGDTDAIKLDDVLTFLKRSKLSDEKVRFAWSLAASKSQNNTTNTATTSSDLSSTSQTLHRQNFFICLKLIALAQQLNSTNSNQNISLEQLVEDEDEDSTRLPLPNFGLRACAAAEALTPRSEIDRLQKDMTTSRGSLSVYLPKHESTDHTSYQISTHVDRGGSNVDRKYPEYPVNEYKVWRRYNDFRWLYNTLCVRYPGTIVPPLPRSKPFGNMEPSFIKERQAELEFFLQSVVLHPILQKSFFLKTFLISSRRGIDAAVNITEESKRTLAAVVEGNGTGGGRGGRGHEKKKKRRNDGNEDGNGNQKGNQNQNGNQDVGKVSELIGQSVSLWNWAYGRIKEKVTDQITVSAEDITTIVGIQEEAEYNIACDQLTSFDIGNVVKKVEELLSSGRERTFQCFKVGEALQALASMEVVAKSTTDNTSDLGEVGNLLETLANLETELHDDTVQRFLTPLRQSAIQTEAASVVISNHGSLVENVGRARASAKYHKKMAAEIPFTRERMSPTSTKVAEEEEQQHIFLVKEAEKHEQEATKTLQFLVANFPHEVLNMRSEFSTVLRGVLLERARAQGKSNLIVSCKLFVCKISTISNFF